MRIKCLHGYFIFEETKVGQISDFMSRFGFELVPVKSYYTFADLQDAPRYSLAGGTLLDAPAITTFEGEPWEVFEANSVVYDFANGLVLPISSILQATKVSLAGNRFVSPGLILPGSTTAGGKRVKDYSAWYSRDTLRFLYSEVTYV